MRAAASKVALKLLKLYQGENGLRNAKFALRITKGPTDACIPFHCDGPYAKSTTQIALNDDYQGGRLVYWTKGTLHVTHRPPGTMTHHEPTILHAVTRLVSGWRCSFFVLDKENGLGDRDVLDWESAGGEARGDSVVRDFCNAYVEPLQ
jgi:hypothetical protein